MSVLVSRRKESRFEAIVFADELHKMLIDFMQRSFGVKNLHSFVRKKFNPGTRSRSLREEMERSSYLMTNFRTKIDELATSLELNLRAANTIYPTSMAEYEQRRSYQDAALVNCEQIIKELQNVVETFDVDINVYERYAAAIDREINLIKRWRQRDNKIKSYLEGSI